MGRPGYMSLYADERTQQIFDEYVRIIMAQLSRQKFDVFIMN